jgi:ABC-type branched-subunit amino acid transport system substrate-binding protein
MGIDAGGNKLGPTMPRYKMSLNEIDALLAYLKKVGDTQDPGLTSDTIRIGVILPPRDHLASAGEEIRSILQSFVAARNAAGPLYDRKLELVFSGADGTPSERAAAAKAFIVREQPFALVSSFTDGADDELAAVAEEQGIPLLATISSRAQSSGVSRRYVRDLVAGVADQTRALGQFISRRFQNANVAVLHGRDEFSKGVADAALRELKDAGVRASLHDSATPARTLKESGIDTILYAGAPAELSALASAMRDLEWSPAILVSSALVHPDALDRSHTTARVFIALPIGPGDQTAEAIAAWRKLTSDDGAGTRHQLAQFGALASAHILIAALQRAGRDLSRDKLLDAIDAISALETGLVPPLTFTPTRHVGSTGVYIVGVHSEGNDVVWVDPG